MHQRPRRPAAITGVPIATSRALDRLDNPWLSSTRIKHELAVWREVAHRPRAALRRDNNDWTRFIGPIARDRLEQALRALPHRHRLPLQRRVARLDAMFAAKTMNDSLADPSLVWWSRRW